jgi:hypothetical protein
MKTAKTVIVVGAGASKEVGFPTGLELKQQIKDFCDFRWDDGFRLSRGNSRVLDTLKILADQRKLNIQDYIYSLWRIRDAIDLSPSIDNFIDAHRNDPVMGEVGKISIFSNLSMSEKTSKLYAAIDDRNESLIFSSLDNVWYTSFFRILVEGNTIDSFKEAITNLCIISFNYDRSILFYLRHAVSQYYGIRFDEAVENLRDLRIHYPYGSLGELAPLPGKRSRFGTEWFHDKLIEYSKAIRTFTEQAQSETRDAIREELRHAEIIVFLGFAFHPQNMKLMLEDSGSNPRKVIGTRKGLSNADIEIIKQEIYGYCGKRVDTDLVDATCNELFHHYRRFLAY